MIYNAPQLKTNIMKTLFNTEHKTKNYKGEELIIASVEFNEDIELLRSQCYRLIRETKEEGTCVIGGGIKLKYFVPGKRTPNTLCLFRNPFQGNVASWTALEPVMEYINQYFSKIGFYYEEGNMD